MDKIWASKNVKFTVPATGNPAVHDVNQWDGAKLPGVDKNFDTVRYAYPFNWFWVGDPISKNNFVDTHRAGVRPIPRNYTQIPYFDEEFVHTYQGPCDWYSPVNPWYKKYGETISQP